MSTTSSRLPFSVPNVVVIVLSFGGAIATGLLGNIPGTVLLAVLGIGILISALAGRRPGASDWLRVNAVEYRDERDSRLASHGFAVVGAWALGLSMLEVIAATIFTGAVGFDSTPGPDGGITYTIRGAAAFGLGLEAIAAVQLFVLALVWGIANTRAVKRG